jgi:hypothetical protein
MREEHLHATDEQLLLTASGDLSAGRRRIQVHLECCSECRARLEELETTMAEFGQAHRNRWHADLPPVAGARALLKARLAESAAQEYRIEWLRSAWVGLVDHRGAAALASVAMAACLLLALRAHWPLDASQPMSASLGHLEEPDLRLTPGATVPVTESDVCGTAAERSVSAVPASLKRKVFEMYGVTPQKPDAYEVDYLITPELGGATDIRNLWPEPYQNTVWNARVKDQLETRLHEMVCHGDVDLPTAQHDISSDWIAAYRKYFHADYPVTDNSSLNSSSFRPSLPVT